MTAEMFTEPWARAWAEELNGSEAYRTAAKDWHGSVCFKLRDRDRSKEKSIFLDLEEGHCRSARSASEEDQRSATFVLTARERVWQKLVVGRSDPLVVLMTGQIRFERGRLIDFAGQGKAAQELMRAAQRIDSSDLG